MTVADLVQGARAAELEEVNAGDRVAAADIYARGHVRWRALELCVFCALYCMRLIVREHFYIPSRREEVWTE